MKYIKHLLIVLSFLSAAPVIAQTPDTIQLSQRISTYYYDDWWDVSPDRPNAITIYTSHKLLEAQRHWAPDSLPIIGIAGSVVIDSVNQSPIYMDTSLKGRVPEYFQLYDATENGPQLMAQGCWSNDTTPRTIILPSRLPYGMGMVTKSFPLYEVYFDTKYFVKDSFYLGFTSFNNYDSTAAGYPAHLRTAWVVIDDASESGWPDVQVFLFRVPYITDDWNDTNWLWRENSLTGRRFLCLIPIIDTSLYTPSTGTTCDSVTGFHLMPPSEDGSVSLAWDQGSQTRWDISYGVSGTQPDAGQILTTPAPFFHLYGLDSTQWYVAYVRNVCDDGTSPWSDSLRFRVTTAPPQDPTVGILTSAADRYTKLWPNPTSGLTTLLSSFRIRDYALYTLDGILLERHKVDAISATIDMSRHPQGTYIIAINTIRGTVTRKLVIK